MALLGLAGTVARADEDANTKLFEVHSRLAAKGSSEAQFKLGEMWEEGRGTPLDLAKAREWYTLAAQQGHEEAKKRLTTLGQRQTRDDAARMEREAELGRQRAEEERRNALSQKRDEEQRRAADERQRAEAEREARQRTETQRQAQQQAEAERARAAALARKQEEERARAALAAKAAAQTPPAAATPAQKPADPAVPASATSQESFETDPCKGAAARFMSTCR